MMKTLQRNLYALLCLLIISIHVSAVHAASDEINIKAGKASLRGKIASANQADPSGITINLMVPHPISGEYANYEAIADKSGQFSIDVDVEITQTLIALTTSINPEHALVVKLASGGTTNLNLSYGLDNGLNVLTVDPAMDENDMKYGFGAMNKMLVPQSARVPEPLYNKTTAYFLNYADQILEERLASLRNDNRLSPGMKGVFERDFRMFMYMTHVFDYDGEMLLNYRNVTGDDSNKPALNKIDRSYFRFLKNFDLNNSTYLQCFTFLDFQKNLLQNETLALPAIGDMSVSAWIKSVKAILADKVGFDKGQYYDILAANAYARQLTEKVEPLTARQKEHISAYWKGNDIAKILLRKNEKVVEVAKAKTPVVVNDVSGVPVDEVMEAITAKYKGKVVFVDLWATWCAPCIDAMQQFKATKDGLREQDVAFVYLTNGSSPKKLWEDKIKGIGSEHYYLTAAQWAYVMEKYDFEAIPSYLLFNKQGKLINQFTGFPGSEKVGAQIKNLL
jgi:thiol-disulfide isomerase/thioredoxin